MPKVPCAEEPNVVDVGFFLHIDFFQRVGRFEMKNSLTPADLLSAPEDKRQAKKQENKILFCPEQEKIVS